MGYFEIFIVFFFLVIFCNFFREKNGLPTNWPILGMFPALLKNVHRIHAYIIELLKKSHNMSFHFNGPWFANMHLLVTTDPTNIHYVMSKNFGNYPKGAKLREMLDVIGDGVINADFILWQYHRKMTHSLLSHPKFHDFLVKVTLEKVENALIPVLDNVSKRASEVDLQDLFARFMSDTISIIIMDHDPKFLSIDLPSNPPSNALYDIEEAIFYRRVMPTWVWKFQRWLNVGKENKYKKAWQTLDNFIYRCIALKKEEISKEQQPYQEKKHNEGIVDLLTLYIKDDEAHMFQVDNLEDKFLRDMILSIFIAGRDTMSVTLSWFFYNIFKNPTILSEIKNELDGIKVDSSNFKEVNKKLIYLHATLCETLRLYPPIPFEAKSPIESDLLPSGHQVHPVTQIIIDLYAMGRMKSIWGDDCNQFRPDRWITEQGKIRHEPSYKFFTFNAGPRSCLGKDMAFTQMKIVAATILQNYVIEVVDEHHIVPDLSLILHMKYGFKVRIICSQ